MEHSGAILVRAAVESDRGELARIMGRAFLTEQARYLPEAVDDAFVMQHAADLVRERWPAMYLALTADGVPIAMACAERGKIEAVNVLSGFQRRGVGTALMIRVERDLRGAGFASAELDTQELNTPARAFYEARGYTVVLRWAMTEFTRIPIPMVRMAKRLDDGARAR